jgi:hypothetical protein
LDILNTYKSSLQVTIALSLIHTLCNSLQHALILLSLLNPHRLSPENGCERRSVLSFRVHVLTGRWLFHNSLNSRVILDKDRIVISPNSSSIVAARAIARTAYRTPFLCYCLRPLPSKGRCLQSYYLPTDLHATILITRH